MKATEGCAAFAILHCPKPPLSVTMASCPCFELALNTRTGIVSPRAEQLRKLSYKKMV